MNSTWPGFDQEPPWENDFSWVFFVFNTHFKRLQEGKFVEGREMQWLVTWWLQAFIDIYSAKHEVPLKDPIGSYRYLDVGDNHNRIGHPHRLISGIFPVPQAETEFSTPGRPPINGSAPASAHSLRQDLLRPTTPVISWEKNKWNVPIDVPCPWWVLLGITLVGGFNPSEKYESQWEGWHPIYEMENKIHVPVTTNQYSYQLVKVLGG